MSRLHSARQRNLSALVSRARIWATLTVSSRTTNSSGPLSRLQVGWGDPRYEDSSAAAQSHRSRCWARREDTDEADALASLSQVVRSRRSFPYTGWKFLGTSNERFASGRQQARKSNQSTTTLHPRFGRLRPPFSAQVVRALRAMHPTTPVPLRQPLVIVANALSSLLVRYSPQLHDC